MTDKYHGYYIHGQAPWTKSDLPMAWLKLELDAEADNKRKTRVIGNDAIAKSNANEVNSLSNSYEIFI